MGAYAGQTLTTGAQAKTYADHFIAVHLTEMGKGKTYSQLSAASLAQPKNTALAGLVQTVFRGTTLRSMLLEAYGFWQMGQIALFAAIASFIGAGLLLILSVLGLAPARRVPAELLVNSSADADLMVVGSSGSGGFARLLVGSVSTQVVHYAQCPVVVVPGERQHTFGPSLAARLSNSRALAWVATYRAEGAPGSGPLVLSKRDRGSEA